MHKRPPLASLVWTHAMHIFTFHDSVCFASIAQSAKRRDFTFLLGALIPEGERTMSTIMSDKKMYPGENRKLRDHTASDTFYALTGINLWQPAGIISIPFRLGLISVANMVRSEVQNRGRRRVLPRCDISLTQHHIHGVCSSFPSLDTLCFCSTVCMHLRKA